MYCPVPVQWSVCPLWRPSQRGNLWRVLFFVGPTWLGSRVFLWHHSWIREIDGKPFALLRLACRNNFADHCVRVMGHSSWEASDSSPCQFQLSGLTYSKFHGYRFSAVSAMVKKSLEICCIWTVCTRVERSEFFLLSNRRARVISELVHRKNFCGKNCETNEWIFELSTEEDALLGHWNLPLFFW